MIPPLLPWALEPTYPPGPFTWSGKPVSVPPFLGGGTPSRPDYVTPATIPPAQYFNYLFGAQSATLWFAQKATSSFAGLNWAPMVTRTAMLGSANGGMRAACWHPLSGTWWMAAVAFEGGPPTSPFTTLWQLTPAPEQTWVQPAGNQVVQPVDNFSTAPHQNFVAVAPDPVLANTVWLAVVTSTQRVNLWTFNGSTYTVVPSLNVPAAQATVALHTFKSSVIVGIGTTGGANARVVIEPNPLGVISGVNAVVWRFADNGTVCLAMPGFTTTPNGYWTSLDGRTWVLQILSFLNTGESIFGLAATQDDLGPCFLCGINTVGGQARFVVSHDGVLWVPQSSPATIGQGVDLAGSTGSGVVCTCVDGSVPAFSPDGGVTWFPLPQLTLGTAPISAAYYEPPTVETSGVGWLVFRFDSQRLSYLQGLPALSM